jgi:hypothetical protein
LASEPGDDLASVLLLLREIFVLELALGIPRSAKVDSDGSHSESRKIGMEVKVADHRSVPPTIGDHLDDDRHPLLGPGPPERRRDPGPIGKGDPQRL